jgi:hypothetical protein
MAEDVTPTSEAGFFLPPAGRRNSDARQLEGGAVRLVSQPVR